MQQSEKTYLCLQLHEKRKTSAFEQPNKSRQRQSSLVVILQYLIFPLMFNHFQTGWHSNPALRDHEVKQLAALDFLMCLFRYNSFERLTLIYSGEHNY